MKVRSLVPIFAISFISIFIFSRIDHAFGFNEDWSEPVDITEKSTANWRAYGIPICDKYQNLHIFWADNTDDGAAIFYRNDIKDIWSPPVDIIAVNDPRIHSLAGVFSSETDTFHLAWVNIPLGNLYYSNSNLVTAGDPKSWSSLIIVDQFVFNPAIGVDHEGTIHLVYAATDAEALNFDVIHSSSSDDGRIWSDPVVIYSMQFEGPSIIRTELAIDGKDRIHVGLTLRSQEYGVFYEVGYMRSLDGGNSWSAYRMIENTSRTFQGTDWISPYAFDEDEIHLTWHNPDRMHQWSYDGGETWGKPIEIIRLGGAFGGPNEIVKDSSGAMYAVTAVSDGVYSSIWQGTSWGPSEIIDDRTIDPHGQHIIVCQGNQLHVIYYDRTGEETVWYAKKEVNAPHIPRRAIPVEAYKTIPPDETQSSNEPLPPVAQDVQMTRINIQSNGEEYKAINPVQLVLASALPAGLLIIVVVIISKKRSRAEQFALKHDRLDVS